MYYIYNRNFGQLSSEKVELSERVDTLEDNVINLQAQDLQQTPLYVETIDECTDTAKLYILPDGYIYAYMDVKSADGTEEVTEQITGEFTEDYRLSTSTGGLTAMEGAVTSPLIDITGYGNEFTIHLDGTGASAVYWGATTAVGGCSIDLYNNGTFVAGGYTGQTNLSNIASITYNVIDKHDIDINFDLSNMLTEFTHVRFSAVTGRANNVSISVTYEKPKIVEIKEWANTGLIFISSENINGGTIIVDSNVKFVNTIEECTDTSKLYVLPDGYIYAYTTVTTEGSTEVVTEQITDGFLNNTRLSTSSGEPKTQNNFVTTPLIDISKYSNWKIRLTGVKWTASDDGATLTDGYAYSLWNNDALYWAYYSDYKAQSSDEILSIKGHKINIISRTEVEFSPYNTTAALPYTHVRFSGQGTADTAIVEIIYDRITEEGTETKWVNTGHAFTPADYEDRIITLEADNALLKSDNTALKVRVKALEDTTVYGNDIPNYVLTEAEEVADKVLAVRNANSFVMALASDLHTNGTDNSSVSVLHAGQGMNIINSLTQLDLVALLGDYEIYRFSYGDGDTDGEDARKSFKHAKKCFYDVAKCTPFMMLQGNHDELPSDTTEEGQQKYYAYIGANNVGTVTDYNNKFRNYGYRDFENYKIRVIYLNTVDVSEGGGAESCHVSTEQLNWLNTVALNLTDSEWGIVVLSHHPLNWDGMSGLLSALDTYKGKGSGAELIAHFHGHLHNFRSETLGTNNVLTITIPNACFSRNNEYGMYEGYPDATKNAYGDTDSNGNQRQFNKTAGTAEDTSFNVIVVDRGNRIIHAFNYGAGIDRVITY